MLNISTLEQLLLIDSPSGFTHRAADFICSTLESYGWKPERTQKGAVRCTLGTNPTLAIAGHTDTLGAIVSGVKANGTLSFSLLGGPLLPTFEASYVRIYTLGCEVYTGTVLFNNPSTHANRKAASEERSIDNMHIRLDEEVKTKSDVANLGIRTGDIVCFDVKFEFTKSGFIKSHFLDNKAGCFVQFEIARRMAERGMTAPVELFFSTYEEVGHGGTCGYSDSVRDLLVIDMGVVGDACEGDEYSCSICAKDSSGPYDYHFRKSLVDLAVRNSIPHAIDVYPYYGSDGSAALRAGRDYRVALIGPGVAASHGMERTHIKALDATIDLCMKYIETL
ncbi:MAG: M42 family metallopeptidase [Candidatus Kapabacteria bacterium]|nr:M42 family metallopeptidase [Candidatus Kapabacteria bacterium]